MEFVFPEKQQVQDSTTEAIEKCEDYKLMFLDAWSVAKIWMWLPEEIFLLATFVLWSKFQKLKGKYKRCDCWEKADF